MRRLLPFALLVFPTAVFSQSRDAAFTSSDIVLLSVLVLVALLVLLDLLVRRKKVEDSEPYRQIASERDRLDQELKHSRERIEEFKDRATRADAKVELYEKENQALSKSVARWEATEERRQGEHETRLTKLDQSKTAFEAERNRVIEEERAGRAAEEENRNRIWNEHESAAVYSMAEVCRKAGVSLPAFDNNNLPDDFDIGLKPDFLVRVIGQYVIFDAKTSKSANINGYLAKQAKDTAQKINKSPSANDIYKTAFFVVPDIAIPDLTETYYLESGISFYVIPLQAFEPIVRTLQRLEDYDLADKYDPQERENIVNVLATFENHIREQNAANTLMTLRGLSSLAATDSMPEDVNLEIEAKRRKLTISGISQAQLKKLMNNPDTQVEEIRKLIAPQSAPVDADEIIRLSHELDASGSDA